MKKVSRRSFLGQITLGISSTAFAVGLPNISKPRPASAVRITGKKLNIALCGLGNYAGMLADGLAESHYCKLSGLVTGHADKSRLWQKKYNIPAKNIYDYSNFDEIINNKDIDVVYVVLPNAMHKEFVLRAARAGKHVITEKPMATSGKDCEEMIAACRTAGVQLGVGYRLHYEPHHLEIKRFGQQKVFGEVNLIEAGLGYKTYERPLQQNNEIDFNDPVNWRLRKTMSGGGPLIELGVYCLQSCRYVLGKEPIAVTAQFGPVKDRIRFSEVEESISWQMEFEGGSFSNCIASYGFNIDRFYASADNGFFEMSPALSHGPFRGQSTNGPIIFPDINQQATQLDAIGKLILENKALPDHISGEEGLKDITIVEAIYKAAVTGKKVMLNGF